MEIDPPDKQARQAVQTRTTFEPHPKIDSGKPTSTNPMMHVHPERIPGISNPKVQTQPSNLRREERNSQYPAEVNVKTPRDIAIKTEAFLSDFGLPLVAPDYLNVQIYSLVGNTPIASSYSTVVADGESLWLEIPESSINWKPFYRRQRTTSRQYWTANGVTLHQQLALETGRIPRRHKLAVRVHRDAPSSTLMKGKFCIHAHQIKIQVGDNSLQDWRKLRTNQLISQLKYTFGSLYHPRTSPDPQARKLPTDQIQHPGRSANLNPANPGLAPMCFPMPMQAPLPWVNPAYYNGQVPITNFGPSQGTMNPTYFLGAQNQWIPCQPGQSYVYPSINQGSGNINA